MPANSTPVFVLTGGLASGKSTAAKLLENMGCIIIDTDVLSKALLEPKSECFTFVVNHFGSSIVQDSGILNRRKLREIIFNSPSDKQFLENLLHPRIRTQVYKTIESLKMDGNRSKAIVIVVPLLTSKDAYPADKIITIEAPIALQIERVMKRDGISRTLATQMIESQPSSKQRETLADVVIWNEGEREKLQNSLLKSFPK